MVDFPINFFLFGYEFSSHLFFELLGSFLGFQYYRYLRKKSKDSLSDVNRLYVILGATIGALLGSRLLGSLVYPEIFFSFTSVFDLFLGGKTIVGGLIGGLIGVEIMKKIIGEKNSSGDLLVYPVLIAMMIGRIGCLLTGVYDNTVGVETDFFLGFDQGDGLSRHPTSLYEIVFLALLFFVLKNIETSKKLLPGDLFKLFLSGYLLFRFCIDFLKPYPEVFLGLGSLQIACLLVLLYYAKIFIQRFFFSSQHG